VRATTPRAEETSRASPVAEQGVVRGAGGQRERVGRAQAGGLGRQLLGLARLRIDRLDLGDAVAQEVGLAPQLRGPADPVGELGRGDPPPVVGLPELLEIDAGVPVQGRALGGRSHEPQLVGLPVDGE
jgi:hypothetical protein